MRCKQFLDGLRQLKQATANEVGALVARDNTGLVGSIRRRASDLHRDGLIRVVGRRNCKVTGKPVTVYERQVTKDKPDIDDELLTVHRTCTASSGRRGCRRTHDIGAERIPMGRASKTHWMREIDRLVKDGR